MLIPGFQQLIEDRIQELRFSSFPASLYEPASYMLSLGGKRIRPVLTLMGCAVFKGDISKALNPALALEIFHNFTLVHDDLMDNADMRRGQASVHKKWNESTAVLSGDVMLVLAYEKLMEGMQLALIPKAMELFSSTARKVCEGQEWDMLFESQEDVAIADYINMIGLKTAALLAGCLQMGALLAVAPAEQQALIYDFGYTLGTAFQIQDDLLDAYGIENNFGKKIGGDIAANKKTFLTLKTIEKSNADDRAKLKSLLSQSNSNEADKIAEVMALYDGYGIKAEAETARDTYYKKAMADLDAIQGDPSVKVELRSLAQSLINRDK